VLDDSKYAYGD